MSLPRGLQPPTKRFFYKQRTFLFPIIKRSIDITGSLILFFFFSPLIFITALCIKIYTHSNIFFKQKRVGQNSTPFLMYKFCTMYPGDNDARLKKYPDLYEKYKNNGWKLSLNEDPRITPIGKILRRLSIDELPQLINVFRNEMSLVGPRAYREEELQEYSRKYPHTQKYIQIIRTAKPGITGLWQTSGRNQLNFEDRAKLDAYYIVNRSLKQEIIILLKTPLAMLSIW